MKRPRLGAPRAHGGAASDPMLAAIAAALAALHPDEKTPRYARLLSMRSEFYFGRNSSVWNLLMSGAAGRIFKST
jgi:hypothetical protein